MIELFKDLWETDREGFWVGILVYCCFLFFGGVYIWAFAP